jgi:OFA family oxalate/formate antiporter-like MFS transporter
VKKTRFYGWTSAALCFIIVFIGTGIAALTFSIYTLPVTEHYAISRTTYSFTRSISSVCGAVTYFFYGPLVKRMGLKRSIVISLMMNGIAFLLYASGFGVWTLFLGAIVSGVFGGFIGNSALVQIVNNWFNIKRGLIIGIICAASGIGGSIFSPVLGIILERFGWQISCLLTAALLILCAVPVFFLLVINPWEKGQQPLGKPVVRSASTAEGYSMSDIWRDWRFWLTLMAFLLVHTSNSPSYFNVTPHMLDTGYASLTITGVMMVILLICNAGAKPLMGIASDKLGVIAVVVATCSLSAAGALMMSFLQPEQDWYGILCVVLIGSGTPISTVAVPLILTRVFGSKEYGTVMGLTLAFGYIGTTCGTPLSNYLFDLTGSYNISYQLNAALMVIAMIMLVLVLICPKTQETVF